MVMSVIEPEPWWPMIGIPLTAAMSTALPLECSDTLPDAVRNPWPHLSEVTVGLKPLTREELERREDAAVDLTELDVAAAAAVHLDPRIGEHEPLQRLLVHQQDLPDRQRPGVRGERVGARGAVDRGGLQQLPAVEDRLGVDLRRALTRGLDLELSDAAPRTLGGAEAAEDRAADDLRAGTQRLELHVGGLGVDAEDLLDAGPEDLEGALGGLALQHLLRAAVLGRRLRAAGWRTGAPWRWPAPWESSSADRLARLDLVGLWRAGRRGRRRRARPSQAA